MCGRFTLHTEKQLLARQFEVDLSEVGELQPSYNIAPSQEILTLRHSRSRDRRIAQHMRWGLVPRWMKPLDKRPPMINARVETIATTPAYRDAFRRRRCLIVADGFYEWQSIDRRSPRQPHWVSLRSRKPFAMAGIWELWFPPEEPEAEPLITCSIVTARANLAVQMIHSRMPVILTPERADAWIDPTTRHTSERLLELLRPVGAAELAAQPVSFDVNSPDNDDPHLIEAVEHPSPTLF